MLTAIEPFDGPAPQLAPAPAPPPAGGDFSLRPRLVWTLATAVVGFGLPAVLLVIAYRTATFDPRIALYGPWLAGLPCLAARARIVVADGVVWRRRFARYRPFLPSELVRVEARRARYSRREGLPITLVRARDRAGHVLSFKPAFWHDRGRALAATLSACAAAQGLVLDDETVARLGHGVMDAAAVPTWAYRPAANVSRQPPEWAPTRLPRRRLLPVLGVVALLVPVVIVVGRAGTGAVRSARCLAVRHLWSGAPDFPTGDAPPVAAAQSIQSSTPYRGVAPGLYRLGTSDIANTRNTRAVQADAKGLVDDVEVGWSQGSVALADVDIAQFASHDAALAFQRDWSEDHCHGPDTAFSTPGVPGGVGYRCGCGPGAYAYRLGFVRGTSRVQVIVWPAAGGDGRADAVRLASAADAAVWVGGSTA